jgi:hypothetical protein
MAKALLASAIGISSNKYSSISPALDLFYLSVYDEVLGGLPSKAIRAQGSRVVQFH